MGKLTPEAGGKKGGAKTFVRKVLGEKPFTSAIMIFLIVVVCLLLGFSKETIERYEDAIIRKGQEILGVKEAGPCSEGWTFYQQDVVGLSFCYPSEWGGVKKSTPNITKLETLPQAISDLGGGGYNNFTLDFDNGAVYLLFLDDKYEYTDLGDGNDVVSKLQTGANLCGSETESSTGKGFYSVCDKDIRTYLVYADEPNTNAYMRSFAYKKLDNGYYNNLIAIYYHGDKIITPTKNYNGIDDALAEIGKSKADFDKEKAQFRTFLDSIKVYVPIPKKEEPFSEVAGEDSRITAIRKYYWLLSAGKTEEAFAMKAEAGKGTYEEFSNQYNDVYLASPYGFRNIGGDDFYFLVKYQDNNKPETEYGVKVTVSDGKLKTTFIEEFKGERIIFGDYSAFEVERSGKNYLILKKGETEKIVDEGESKYNEDFSNIDKVKYFSQIKFSPSGNYLLLTSSGYEWTISSVYDIKSGKLSKGFMGTDIGNGFDITPNEKYIYVCRSGGMDSTVPGEVYTLPDVKKVFDAAPGNEVYIDSVCKYDAGQKAIIFSLSSPFPEDTEPKSKEVKYEVAE